MRNYKCVNCGLPHNANARICPVYKREENIRTTISELKINRYDAIQILEGNTSYADITRTMIPDNTHNISSPWSPIGQPVPPEKFEESTKLTKTPPKRKGQVSERLQTTRHAKQNNDHANWMNHYKREKIGFRTDEPTTPKTRKIEQTIVEEEDQLRSVTKIQHPKMDKNPTVETLKLTYENLNKILPSTTLSNRNRIEKCITDLKTVIIKLSDSTQILPH
ncbi:hypothetical protein C0J52_05540 [Blattella germanica]|nr:hypothetical protein C0J52_05540 [Blattella germanica]